MSYAVIQLLVLAGVAIFLILRLRSVLGTREGYEKPPVPKQDTAEPLSRRKHDFEVIEGGPDRDIADHVPDGSDSAKALVGMKMVEPGFGVSEFLGGARGAYEMILMAFENGDLESIRAFVGAEVYEAMDGVVQQREEAGLTVEANFIGVRELQLIDARFDRDTNLAEITVRLTGELTSVVRNAAGEVIEGDAKTIKKQRDIWTFARTMGSGDPNWQLVATGE